MSKYQVTKKVIEYHHFLIGAKNQEDAERIAEDNDMCYCDKDSASETIVEVESVKQVTV